MDLTADCFYKGRLLSYFSLYNLDEILNCFLIENLENVSEMFLVFKNPCCLDGCLGDFIAVTEELQQAIGELLHRAMGNAGGIPPGLDLHSNQPSYHLFVSYL